MKKLYLIGALLITAQSAHAQDSVLFNDLAKQCAKEVHPDTLQALVRVESSFNPYAIGVVGDYVKQPTSLEEATLVAQKLSEQGKNFSLGLGQINVHNLTKLGLDFKTVFDPCANLAAASYILSDCYNRASGGEQDALQKALSCYYSGNFKTGFTHDLKGQAPYVDRVKTASLQNTPDAKITIPAINPTAPKPLDAPSADRVVAKVVNKPVKTQPSTVNVSHQSKATWDAFGDFN
ncbi:lytic transglycosylase domain-containing protein [Pelistega sp. MC2]|uniref:lytic transglycosylase domain-containing protein n=1 Tax=Pelistega sp. MC2 TaxID=1720297 RepID=UPI0008D9E068|nr:lytic transglycosylase domain-containing protein [Pelistega sp. MC2]